MLVAGHLKVLYVKSYNISVSLLGLKMLLTPTLENHWVYIISTLTVNIWSTLPWKECSSNLFFFFLNKRLGWPSYPCCWSFSCFSFIRIHLWAHYLTEMFIYRQISTVQLHLVPCKSREMCTRYLMVLFVLNNIYIYFLHCIYPSIPVSWKLYLHFRIKEK